MTDLAEIVRKLKARPGRGGVRLSYQEADVVLEMIRAEVERRLPDVAQRVLEARAVADERGTRYHEWGPDEILTSLDVHG